MQILQICLFVSFFLSGCVSIKKFEKSPPLPGVIEINSMSDAERYIRRETLVLFDLDHTIFEGATVYGHANWFYDRVTEGRKNDVAAEDTVRRIFPAWLQSQERTRVKPVESVTPNLIKRLQDMGVNVMGLTARQTPLIPATLRQLNEIGIDFQRTSLMPAIFGANEFHAPVAFRSGIIFTTEYVKKSDVLKAYLERIQYRPKHIVFVDDSLKHVEDIVAMGNAMNIPVTGLHYPLVDTRRSSWDENYAAKIFEECGRDNLPDQCSR